MGRRPQLPLRRAVPYAISACRSLEHSIENQLPFLQHVLGSPGPSPGARPFAIAPVCVGWLGSEAAAGRLARQLAAAVARYEQRRQRQVLLIATSDFTHGVSVPGQRRLRGGMQ